MKSSTEGITHRFEYPPPVILDSLAQYIIVPFESGFHLMRPILPLPGRSLYIRKEEGNCPCWKAGQNKTPKTKFIFFGEKLSYHSYGKSKSSNVKIKTRKDA